MFGDCLSRQLHCGLCTPKVFSDPTQDSCALEVGSRIPPLEDWQLEESRQQEARPSLSTMAVSLDQPLESRRNGLTYLEESR